MNIGRDSNGICPELAQDIGISSETSPINMQMRDLRLDKGESNGLIDAMSEGIRSTKQMNSTMNDTTTRARGGRRTDGGAAETNPMPVLARQLVALIAPIIVAMNRTRLDDEDIRSAIGNGQESRGARTA